MDKSSKKIVWNKGKKLSDEHKKKLSISHKGYKMPDEQKRKISKSLKKVMKGKSFSGKRFSWKGLKMSEDTKRKMSLSSLGKKKSLQHRLNISNGRKGIKFSDEHVKRLSESHKGKQPLLGFKHSEESKIKMSQARIGRFAGENSFTWRGGISFEPYAVDWTECFKESIRKRDKYVCFLCGVNQCELKRRLHVHHIDYDKKNCCPKNLISLCQTCHFKTNYNREYWTKYFNKKTVVHLKCQI